MSTGVKKKKKKGTYDNTKLVAIIAIALAVIVVASIVITVVMVYTGNYVARVKGEKLYNYEYEYYLNQRVSRIGEDVDVPDSASTSEREEVYSMYLASKGEDGLYPLVRYKQEALEELQEFKISYLLARDKGYKLTAEENRNVEQNVEYTVNMYYRIYSQSGTNITYDEVVDYVCGGMDLSQYKSFIKLSETVGKYKADLMDSYNISDAEIKEVYDAEPNDYRSIDIQKMELVADEDDIGEEEMTDDQKAELKAKAEDYIAKFKSGELDFTETIKKESAENGADTSEGKSTVRKGSETGIKVVDDWAYEQEKASEKDEYALLESDTAIYIVKCLDIYDINSPATTDSEGNEVENTIISSIRNTIKSDRADEQIKAEAKAAQGYDLTNVNQGRIDQIFNDNTIVKNFIANYGAKVSD